MQWDEWWRDCDVELGYYWPSDPMSEEGSSAAGSHGSLGHDDIDDDWMSGVDDVNGWGSQAGQSRAA